MLARSKAIQVLYLGTTPKFFYDFFYVLFFAVSAIIGNKVSADEGISWFGDEEDS